MLRFQYLLIILTVCAIGSSPFALPSYAADYSAGDPCSASGAFHTTNDANGVDILVCDGANWRAAISYFSAGGLAISSMTGQPAPQYSSGGSGASPGGSDTHIQFNSGGSAFGADADFVWNQTSNKLTVTGDIDYTGVLTDTSDRRLKENIAPLEESLARITSLQGISFTMKDDEAALRELGFIAQDVEPHFPALVRTKDDGLKTLNYIGLIAPLVEAVKEQQVIIEKLEAANANLEARLQKLEEQGSAK